MTMLRRPFRRPENSHGGIAKKHEFQSAHEECRSEFVQSDRDDLMRRVGDHLREAHNIGRLTETLRSYLEATSMTAR